MELEQPIQTVPLLLLVIVALQELTLHKGQCLAHSVQPEHQMRTATQLLLAKPVLGVTTQQLDRQHAQAVRPEKRI